VASATQRRIAPANPKVALVAAFLALQPPPEHRRRAASSPALAPFRLRLDRFQKNWERKNSAMAKNSKGRGAENGAADGRAVGYLRSSSAANLGGDSELRQREAIRAYAARAGLEGFGDRADAPGAG